MAWGCIFNPSTNDLDLANRGVINNFREPCKLHFILIAKGQSREWENNADIKRVVSGGRVSTWAWREQCAQLRMRQKCRCGRKTTLVPITAMSEKACRPWAKMRVSRVSSTIKVLPYHTVFSSCSIGAPTKQRVDHENKNRGQNYFATDGQKWHIRA